MPGFFQLIDYFLNMFSDCSYITLFTLIDDVEIGWPWYIERWFYFIDYFPYLCVYRLPAYIGLHVLNFRSAECSAFIVDWLNYRLFPGFIFLLLLPAFECWLLPPTVWYSSRFWSSLSGLFSSHNSEIKNEPTCVFSIRSHCLWKPGRSWWSVLDFVSQSMYVNIFSITL